MKRYWIYVGMLFMACFCFFSIGCKRSDGDNTKCILCGDNEDSIKSIYSHCQGVGLFCLDDQRMIEIQPSPDGWIKDNAASYVWGDTYSVQVDRIMDRGVSLVRYTTSDKKDASDLDGLSVTLCPDCMEDVKESVRIYGKHEDRKEKPVCLVDFSTMELYGIQQSFQYYMLDDYYVQASCQGEKIQLTVFQTCSDTWHESQIVLE